MRFKVPRGFWRATRLAWKGLADAQRVTRARPATRGMLAGAFSNGAGQRAYRLYVPAGAPAQNLPLLVMLHGCEQDPLDFAAGTRMNLLADELGFAVVYPAQSRAANGSGCWNWFESAHQVRESGEPSLIAGITREVIARAGLDARRTYVAGLSAGGAMAAVMAATYPELYAAIGIHSGLRYAAASDLPSAIAAMRGSAQLKPAGAPAAMPVPAIVFHGDRDTTVHPSNGEHAWADAAASVKRGRANGRAYTRTTYRDGAGKPVLEHWLLHGAGHAWSGGSPDGSFTDPRGPDASREMLRFFRDLG